MPAAEDTITASDDLVLDCPDVVLKLVRGKAFVFARNVADTGQSGRRHFLFERAPGDYLFASWSGKLPLLVCGIDADFEKLSAAEFFDFSAVPEEVDTRIDSIESWIKDLSLIVAPGLPPPGTKQLAQNQPADLKANQVASVEKGLAWVSGAEADCRFLGLEQYKLTSGGYTALTSDTWIQCLQDCTVEVKTTLSIADEGRLKKAVDSFHDFIAGLLDKCVTERLHPTSHSLKLQIEHMNLDLAIREMVGVLATENKSTGTMIPGQDLFNAAQIVGQAAHIDILAPAARKQSSASIEYLNDLVLASRCRMRTVTLDKDWWKSDCGPLLGFSGEHEAPRALLPGAKGYVCIDPADGSSTLLDQNSTGDLGKMAVSFYRSLPDVALSRKDVLSFALTGRRKDIGRTLAAALVLGLISLALPLGAGILLAVAVPCADFHRLTLGGIILLSTSYCYGLLQFIRLFSLARIEQLGSTSLEAAMWDRLLRLPIPFFRQFGSGDIIDRTMTMEKLRDLTTKISDSLSVFPLVAASNLTLMLILNWQVTLPVLLVVATGLILLLLVTGKRAEIEHNVLKEEGKFIGLSMEIISNIAKLRVAGAQNRALSRWYHAAAAKARWSFMSQSIDGKIAAVTCAVPTICTLVLFAGTGLGSSPMPLREYLIYNMALAQFVAAMLAMVDLVPDLQLLAPLYNRVRPFLEALPETEQSGVDPGALRGDIEFNSVSYSYDPSGPPVLCDVSFKVRKGEFIAFVGRSGSGKSSLLKLLLGFEKASSGAIFFDGKSLDELDVREVRRQMGVVLQNDKLMPGSVYINIVGSSALTMEDAHEAARMAGLARDIEAMPLGMETVLLEGAGTISGGQKQRLLIARALVRKPRILVFDEATSALDNKTQAEVIESLQQLKSTRIVVAQRLSTVQSADRIYVLEQGRIVESGTFAELMSRGGTFAELARRQLV